MVHGNVEKIEKQLPEQEPVSCDGNIQLNLVLQAHALCIRQD